MELPTGIQDNIQQYNHFPYGMTLFALSLPTNYEQSSFNNQYTYIPNIQHSSEGSKQ